MSGLTHKQIQQEVKVIIDTVGTLLPGDNSMVDREAVKAFVYLFGDCVLSLSRIAEAAEITAAKNGRH